MELLKTLGIELHYSDDEENEENAQKSIEITDNFSLYLDYTTYIFKCNGKNVGWLGTEKEARAFMVEYATKFEKERKNSNLLITRETSEDGLCIKIFSKSLGMIYDGSPEIVATLEIEKIDQIE